LGSGPQVYRCAGPHPVPVPAGGVEAVAEGGGLTVVLAGFGGGGLTPVEGGFTAPVLVGCALVGRALAGMLTVVIVVKLGTPAVDVGTSDVRTTETIGGPPDGTSAG
jgi:hypothetical protein